MRTEDDYSWILNSKEENIEPVKKLIRVELKVGNKVRIKSLKWYEENKNEFGEVDVPETFVHSMTKYCSKEYEITRIMDTGTHLAYMLKGTNGWIFSEEMFDI